MPEPIIPDDCLNPDGSLPHTLDNDSYPAKRDACGPLCPVHEVDAEVAALRAELSERRAAMERMAAELERQNDAAVAWSERAVRAEAEVERMRPVFDQMGAALTHVVDNTTDWMDDSRGANVYEAYEAFETYRATSEQETTDA